MQVEIYGAAWCSSCMQAKKLCESKEQSYSYTDVDDTTALRQLEERLGRKVKAIPQIFLNGEHLPNGFSSLQSVLST